ncbi:hypothetical protein [Longimicrobium sp.]|uniref:hypothetical protein n=1 Tax=Longimicrobium sp. TaxID=2029185 RepID=UPI003B39FF46
MRFRNRFIMPLAGLLLALGACDNNLAPRGPAPAGDAQLARAPARDSLALDPLARALALALRDETLSRQLLEDFRDSPFPDHQIHAASYLAGPRGRPLLDAAAQAAGRRPGELLALAARTSDLALTLPVRLDRISWRGTPNVVVTASARGRDAWVSLGDARGFDGQGNEVTIPMNTPPGFPVIALLRSDAAFGANAEAARARAPRKTRLTVSTREETYGGSLPGGGDGEIGIQACPPNELSCICYENPADSRCQVSAPYNPGGEPTPSNFDWWSCRDLTVNVDSDADGLSDKCEYEVAYAMRPYLTYDPADRDRRREPYWAMYPSTMYSSYHQIVYALSYYYDWGPNYKHQGDSEFIVLRVQYLGYGKWGVASAFLSAHWGAITDSSADITHPSLEYAGSTRGRPKIWVAVNKHANYRSRSSCDAGAAWTDSCDANVFIKGSAAYEVEVLPNANLGNHGRGYDYSSGAERWYPGAIIHDCVPSRVYLFGGRQECYWTWKKFLGWQDNYDGHMDGSSGGAYADVMQRFLYW